MTRDDDDLAALKAALKAGPAADPAARAAALTRAMEAFENSAPATQGTASAARSNPDRPEGAGFWDGVRSMFDALKLRPVLAATTSAAALAVGVFILLPQAQVGLPTAIAPQTDSAPVNPAAADETVEAEVVATEPPGATVAPTSRKLVAEPSPMAQATPGEEAAAGSRAALAAPADAPMAESFAADMAAPVIVGTPAPEPMLRQQENTETFANAPANPVKITAEAPVSTFSIDLDTASYAIVRSALTGGFLPDPEAVRVEEMVNYFPFTLPPPAADEGPFRPTISVMPTPWNPGTRLVQIALQGRLPVINDRPPLNLVFLIDTSGSMDEPNKLPLLKQSLGLMLSELRPEDQVAIVAYAGSAGEVLPPTAAADRAAIMGALDRLAAGGSTAGAEGLELAYQTAARMAGDGEVSRILLATDGDFNVGIYDPEGLEGYIARKRDSGIYLSILGFGRGNLDDAVMQSLAQSGNGTASYIDTLQEARKVLVDQLTGALFPIADDVKIQVEWNPAAVAEYRLIGYETRALNREDFNNDAVDAGEIGAGHAVTAIYEVTAPGSDALQNDPLRYGQAGAAQGATGELGFLRLRWKAPGEEVSTLLETPISADAPANEEAQFAAAIAGFGQLLRGSVYLNDWGWDQAIALAEANRGQDAFGYRIEAVNLMRLAKALSAQ